MLFVALSNWCYPALWQGRSFCWCSRCSCTGAHRPAGPTEPWLLRYFIFQTSTRGPIFFLALGPIFSPESLERLHGSSLIWIGDNEVRQRALVWLHQPNWATRSGTFVCCMQTETHNVHTAIYRASIKICIVTQLRHKCCGPFTMWRI